MLGEMGFQCVLLGEYLKFSWVVGVRALEESLKDLLVNELRMKTGPYYPCHQSHFPLIGVVYHTLKCSDTVEVWFG